MRFTQGSQHGNASNSDILDTLNTWYTTNISSADRAHVDTSAWFCSDREMASGYNWSSQTSSTIHHAAYERLYTNNAPTLQCSNSSDRLTTPNGVGLITADEVAFAGGVWTTANQSYYLYTGQNYWTMSPFYVGSNGWAYLFYVYSNGQLYYTTVSGRLVRPVINLRADTTVTGDGTASSPFVV